MDNSSKEHLEHAKEILEQYCQPRSMIDNGNLFYAAGVYQDAYTKLKSERDAAVEALRFYANKDNWMRDENGWRHDMIAEDLEDESLTDWNNRFSGKRARAALAMIDNGEKK